MKSAKKSIPCIVTTMLVIVGFVSYCILWHEADQEVKEARTESSHIEKYHCLLTNYTHEDCIIYKAPYEYYVKGTRLIRTFKPFYTNGSIMSNLSAPVSSCQSKNLEIIKRGSCSTEKQFPNKEYFFHCFSKENCTDFTPKNKFIESFVKNKK